MNEQQKKQMIKDAKRIAQYLIKHPKNTYQDVCAYFNIKRHIVAKRINLLKTEDPDLYDKLTSVNHRIGKCGAKTKNKDYIYSAEPIVKKQELPKEKGKHYVIKNAAGVKVVDIPVGYKPTPKRKCKNISGKKKVLGHHLFTLTVGSYFDNAVYIFTIKADYPEEAINIMKLMIDHYKMSALSKNKIKIINSKINLRAGMKIANNNVLTPAT